MHHKGSRNLNSLILPRVISIITFSICTFIFIKKIRTHELTIRRPIEGTRMCLRIVEARIRSFGGNEFLMHKALQKAPKRKKAPLCLACPLRFVNTKVTLAKGRLPGNCLANNQWHLIELQVSRACRHAIRTNHSTKLESLLQREKFRTA